MKGFQSTFAKHDDGSLVVETGQLRSAMYPLLRHPLMSASIVLHLDNRQYCEFTLLVGAFRPQFRYGVG